MSARRPICGIARILDAAVPDCRQVTCRETELSRSRCIKTRSSQRSNLRPTSRGLRQLAYLQEKGVKFDRRIDHGMRHSLDIHDSNGYGVELVYELPREVWEGNIDAALNFAELRPHEGPEALIDRTEVPTFGAQLQVSQ